jgi:hypothetical protein
MPVGEPRIGLVGLGAVAEPPWQEGPPQGEGFFGPSVGTHQWIGAEGACSGAARSYRKGTANLGAGCWP